MILRHVRRSADFAPGCLVLDRTTRTRARVVRQLVNGSELVVKVLGSGRIERWAKEYCLHLPAYVKASDEEITDAIRRGMTINELRRAKGGEA